MTGSASVPVTIATLAGGDQSAAGTLDANYSALVNYLNDPVNRANWATDVGTANAYSAVYDPAVVAGSLANGLVVMLRVANTNTATSTFKPYTAATAVTIKKAAPTGLAALDAGDLIAGMDAWLSYDATNTQWILLNPATIIAPAVTDLYVTSYGAVGDGSTDDTAKIAAAETARAAGQRLRFPMTSGGGTYLVTGVTASKAGIWELEEGVTLKLAGSQASGTKLVTISHDNFYLRGGSYDGNKANQGVSTDQDCIYHNGRTQVHIDVQSITGAVAFGFHAGDATDCSVRARSVTLTGNTGIEWEYVSGNLTRCITYDSFVDRSDSTSNAGVCINYTKTGTATGFIIGCKVVHCNTLMFTNPSGTILGVQIWGAGYGNEIIGGFNSGGTTSISLANGMTESKVVGAHAYNFKSLGIEMADAARCTATGNTIDGNGLGTRGITFDGTNIAAVRNVATGNTITAVTDAGIYLFKGSNGCAGSLVTGNTVSVSGASAYGIYNNTCDDVAINSNSLDGASTALAGIALIVCSNISLQGNEFANFTTQAIIGSQNTAGTMDNISVAGGAIINCPSLISFQASGGGALGGNIRIAASVAGWSFGVNGEMWDYSNSRGNFWGAGSPEAVVTAGVGSFFQRTDGGAGTTFYVKTSGTGNTGWTAVG